MSNNLGRRAKRFMEDLGKSRFRLSDEQKEVLLENDIIVTRHGAFKRPKAKGPMPDIFKVQRPLHTNEEVPKVLVYNQSRKFQGTFDITEEWLKFFGDKYKIYVIGIPEADSLKIMTCISDQDW